VRALAEDGAIVDVVHPVEQMVDLSAVRVEHDLYVLRRWGGLALSMAAALHALGATIVNPHPATAALRDKIVTARILLAAGVPTPLSCIAMGPEQLAPMLDGGPIIVKPYTGGNGQRIQIVRAPGELAQVDCHGEPAFAQRYYPHDGRDRASLPAHPARPASADCLTASHLRSSVRPSRAPSAPLFVASWRVDR